MAISEVSDTEVVQRCEKCHNTNRISLDTLVAGVERDGVADEGLVPLPPCPSCHSGEYLFRTPLDAPEHPAPGSFSHLHHLLVDSVHEKLVRKGRVTPALKRRSADSLVAKTLEGKKHEKWFPSGLKLKLPE